ncbi:hypothetical protein D9M71_370540 [compost metagenome]
MAAVPGTRGETAETVGQTPGGIAGGTEGFGEGIQLTPAGAGKDLGGELALAAEVAVEAAGSHPGLLRQPLHGQRGEAAFGNSRLGQFEDAFALGVVPLQAGLGDSICHDLNPHSFFMQ